MKTTHQKILNVTFIALFAALCYIALTVFFIPFANMYIHFGNLIVVLAALLIGGWQGGLAGSVGMGLYDILGGHADSAPQDLCLKAAHWSCHRTGLHLSCKAQKISLGTALYIGRYFFDDSLRASCIYAY